MSSRHEHEEAALWGGIAILTVGSFLITFAFGLALLLMVIGMAIVGLTLHRWSS